MDLLYHLAIVAIACVLLVATHSAGRSRIVTLAVGVGILALAAAI